MYVLRYSVKIFCCLVDCDMSNFSGFKEQANSYVFNIVSNLNPMMPFKYVKTNSYTINESLAFSQKSKIELQIPSRINTQEPKEASQQLENVTPQSFDKVQRLASSLQENIPLEHSHFKKAYSVKEPTLDKVPVKSEHPLETHLYNQGVQSLGYQQDSSLVLNYSYLESWVSCNQGEAILQQLNGNFQNTTQEHQDNKRLVSLNAACNVFYKYYELFGYYENKVNSFLPALVNLYQDFYEHPKSFKGIFPTSANSLSKSIANNHITNEITGLPEYQDYVAKKALILQKSKQKRDLEKFKHYVVSALRNAIRLSSSESTQQDLAAIIKFISNLEVSKSLHLTLCKFKNFLQSNPALKIVFPIQVFTLLESLEQKDNIQMDVNNFVCDKVEYTFINQILEQRKSLAVTYGSYDQQTISKIYIKYLMAEHLQKDQGIFKANLLKYQDPAYLENFDNYIKISYPPIFKHQNLELNSLNITETKANQAFMQRNSCLNKFIDCMSHSQQEFVFLLRQEHSPIFDYVSEDLILQSKRASKDKGSNHHISYPVALARALAQANLAESEIAFYCNFSSKRLERVLHGFLSSQVMKKSQPFLFQSMLDIDDNLNLLPPIDLSSFQDQDSILEIVQYFDVLYNFFLGKKGKQFNNISLQQLVSIKGKDSLRNYVKNKKDQEANILLLDHNKHDIKQWQQARIKQELQSHPDLILSLKQSLLGNTALNGVQSTYKYRQRHSLKKQKYIEDTNFISISQKEFINQVNSIFASEDPIIYSLKPLSSREQQARLQKINDLVISDLYEMFNPQELQLRQDLQLQQVKFKALAYRLTNFKQLKAYIIESLSLHQGSNFTDSLSSIFLDESIIIKDFITELKESNQTSLGSFFIKLLKADLHRSLHLKDLISKVQGQLIKDLSFFDLMQVYGVSFKLNSAHKSNTKMQFDLSSLLVNHEVLGAFLKYFRVETGVVVPYEFIALKNTQAIYSQLNLLISGIKKIVNWYGKASELEQQNLFIWYVAHGGLFSIKSLIKDLKVFKFKEDIHSFECCRSLKQLGQFALAHTLFDSMVKMYIHILKLHNSLDVEKITLRAKQIKSPQYVKQQLSNLYATYNQYNQKLTSSYHSHIVCSELDKVENGDQVVKVYFIKKNLSHKELQSKQQLYKEIRAGGFKVFIDTLCFNYQKDGFNFKNLYRRLTQAITNKFFLFYSFRKCSRTFFILNQHLVEGLILLLPIEDQIALGYPFDKQLDFLEQKLHGKKEQAEGSLEFEQGISEQVLNKEFNMVFNLLTNKDSLDLVALDPVDEIVHNCFDDFEYDIKRPSLESLCEKRGSRRILKNKTNKPLKIVKLTKSDNKLDSQSQAAIANVIFEFLKIKQKLCYSRDGEGFYADLLENQEANDFFRSKCKQIYLDAYHLLQTKFPSKDGTPFNFGEFLKHSQYDLMMLFAQEIKDYKEILTKEVAQYVSLIDENDSSEDVSVKNNFFNMYLQEMSSLQDVDDILSNTPYSLTHNLMYRFKNQKYYQGGINFFLVLGIYNFVKQLYKDYGFGHLEHYLPLHVVLNGLEALENQEAFFYKCSCGNQQTIFNNLLLGINLTHTCDCCGQELGV